jgi:murein DD-endopeptidase MepM/ murein hydrolase activator NlpD
VYKSLASSSVKEGDEVSAGAQIGVAGTMLSENSDGVHLHLEIFENGKLVNPLSYLEIESNK